VAVDIDKYPMFAHPMSKGNSPFYPGAPAPRRLRSASMVDPRFGGKVDLCNDPRIVYHFDISAGSPNFIYPDDRVWGWFDLGPHEFHLNYWNYGAFSSKPYWYSGSAPNNIFNNQPFLYFTSSNEGTMPSTPSSLRDCGIYRWNDDVRDYVTSFWDSSPPYGYLWMGVFYMYYVKHWWNDWADQISSNHHSITCPEVYLSFRPINGRLYPYCDILRADGLSTQLECAPWLGEPVVITKWFNPKDGQIAGDQSMAAYGQHVLRINGETHNIKEHPSIANFDLPDFYLQYLWFGASYRIEIDWYTGYHHSERWAMAKTFLGIGDYTIQEVQYLETQWMQKYGVQRRSTYTSPYEWSWLEYIE
jgi:hypothetical protein